MPKVLVLPDHIASQIAAGEVVERPSSVVKELVENAIDAGATQIEISMGSQCRDIRIADNGCGMAPEDAVLAFQRHATSKISSVDELWSLRTMGFRGEALPSIASVSRITCLTRTAEATAGTKLEAADGKLTTSETGCAQGTVMEITDLFYNVPARLKFLKKPSTELAHIHETVEALAVAYPKIVFQLLNNGEVVLRTSGSGKLAQAMVESGMLSKDHELYQVTYAEMTHEMAIYGYVARPTHFRGDRKGILAIVNNRPVRCPLTYKALEHAYSDLIPKGKYPLAVLTITTDPKQVDVNVHPTKKEIKYSNGNDVYTAIQKAVSDALRSGTQTGDSKTSETLYESPPGESDQMLVSEPGARDAVKTAPRPVAEQLRLTERRPIAATGNFGTFGERRPIATTGSFAPLRPRSTATLPLGWRLIGYLHDTYLLVETPEGLEIIEQHIAHERTIYERVLASQQTPGRLSDNSQRLVISVPLNLTPEQLDTVRNHTLALQNIGFDFEFQGADNSICVCTQVPLELAHKDYALAVQAIINDLSLNGSAELELEASKSVACQAAIKNGMPLTEPDMIQLIADWHKTPRNDTCPHGRPIRLHFSSDKLYQMFHPD